MTLYLNFFIWYTNHSLNIKSIFYDPKNFNDLKNKISKKTKLIYVENPGSNTFEFQDLSKILKFAKKILSNEEMNDFLSSTSQSRFLSKNFASKEALSKALGTGLYREGVYPASVTVTHTESGKPMFMMNDLLTKFLKQSSAKNIFLSISDTNQHSIAMVIME